MKKRELFDPDQEPTATDTDQAVSEEQSYKETLHGIRSFVTGHTSQIWITLLPVQTTTPLQPPTTAIGKDQC